MKKIAFLIIILTTTLYSYSQTSVNKGAKSEYRFFGIKAGVTHNFSFPLIENDYVLLKTPKGDMLKSFNIVPFTYTPGANFSIIYNFDFKNDQAGVVFGAEFSNFGFSNSYRSLELNYVVTEAMRVTTLSIPVYLKFGDNIYKNQLYGTFGLQYNMYLSTKVIQNANWNEMNYIGTVDKQASRTSSFSLIAGFNYNVYFLNLQFLTPNFIAKDYSTITEEGTVRPYQHINFTNSLYLTTGVNIPLTRWLTARNWTAEQIRRFFKRSN